MSALHGEHFELGRLVPNTMNPIRKRLLERMKELLADYNANPVVNHNSLILARELNTEFVGRSRGKGR